MRPIIYLAVLLAAGAHSPSIVRAQRPGAQQHPGATQLAYPVDHVPASSLAVRLRELVAQSGAQGEVVLDRSQNRLIVRGDATAQQVARQALAALDRPQAQGPAPDQPMLQAVPVPEGRLESIATTLQLRYQDREGVRITSDRPTGQLLVLAPAPLQQEIRGKIAEILEPADGVRQASGGADAPEGSERFQLARLSWQGFEDALTRLVGRRLPVTTKRQGEVAAFQLTGLPSGSAAIEVDRRNNEVTVVAPEPALAGWRQIVETLDRPADPPGRTAHLVRLENADPAPIQRAIRLLRQTRSRAAAPDALGLTAPGGNELLAAMPQPPQAEDAGPLQDVPPLQDDEEDQAEAIVVPQDDGPASVLEGTDDDLSGLFGNVQIEFVPELGVIIVRGARRDVQRVLEVIEQIEQQSELTQPEVEVYPLQHADSNAVAELVNELYSEVLAPRQGQVTITALDKPNAVLLIGRREALGGVIDLVQKLDQPVPPSTEFRVFRLRHASSTDAEETLRGFYVADPGADEEVRPGLGTRIRVISDYRTNSLIVQAAPRDMVEVAQLIQKIDVEGTPAESELRVFRLNNALAEDLQTVLQQAISGQSEEGPEEITPASTKLSILSLDEQGNKILDSGILANVVITADENINALVVRAPSSSMELIGELIRQLDQLPGPESVIKVFEVEFGDATSLAQSLQELFGLPVTAGTGTTGAGAGAAGTPGGIGPTQLSAGAETSLVPLRFSVDRRTNSVIVSGSESDLDVVESLLLRLDAEGFADRITEVVWLRNAGAEEVALALRQFVQDQLLLYQNNQFFNQALGPYDQLERDLIVVPEPITNSLIISVAPRLYETIRRVIDELDRRPPMIMIRVILAEVELTDGFEFGSELGLQDSLLFDRSVASGGTLQPGFDFNNEPLGNSSDPGSVATRDDIGTQSLTAFALGRTSDTFGYGGLVLSAASDSVNFLLRTLQDSGRAQILSRPMIMTMDNTEGLVQVGAEVPRVTGVSTQGGFGGTVVTTEDVPVGLILRVSPRVGADGLITMNVDAIRSSVGSESDGIPVGFGPEGQVIRSPQILTTQAQSTITAFSGQTVVYGGLITKDREQFSRRVPYISDIPVLGQLFRYDQERERRTELLVIMTPSIVTSDEDLEYIKSVESSRMSWCLADVVEMHGDVGLSGGYGLWGPAAGPVIYPDLQPSFDDFEGELYADPNCPPGTPQGPHGEPVDPGAPAPPESVLQPRLPPAAEPSPRRPIMPRGGEDLPPQSAAPAPAAPVQPAPEIEPASFTAPPDARRGELPPTAAGQPARPRRLPQP